MLEPEDSSQEKELHQVARTIFPRELNRGQSGEFCSGVMVTYKVVVATEHLKCGDFPLRSTGVKYTAHFKDSCE